MQYGARPKHHFQSINIMLALVELEPAVPPDAQEEQAQYDADDLRVQTKIAPPHYPAELRGVSLEHLRRLF